MMHLHNGSDALSLAVLTVGLDAETIERVMQVAESLPRHIVPCDCGGYLSRARYQFFPQPVKNAHLAVALVDWDTDPAAAVETATLLHQTFDGRIAILALSSALDNDTLLHAMRCGFTDLLASPLSVSELADAFLRIEQRWPNDPKAANKVASILSFFGAKGGVGTTTLLIHLAVYLSKFHGKRVLVIDHHIELGHVSLYLGIAAMQYDFYELLANVQRLDKELLAGFTGTHSSGVDVLASPTGYGASPRVAPGAMELMLDFLSEHYDYILLDCDTTFDHRNEAVMERSDEVYLVATPDIGAIRDLSAFVDQLVKTSQIRTTMHVVMNRYGSREAVSVEQIEKAIRLPIAIRVPNSFAELINAINIGELVMPGKKSPFALAMSKWSDTIAGASPAAEASEKKTSFWGRAK